MASRSSTVPLVPPVSLGQIYTIHDVATLLHVSPRAVQDWIKDGLLPAIRYGKLLRVREADLVAFGQRTAPPTESTDALEE
jgi:excisionase family DNA binding protein